MRVAYLGSRPLAEKILKFLISQQGQKGKDYVDIVCLVTLPDKQIEPSGIDRWWQGSLKPLAQKYQIPVVDIREVPDFKPDILFSVFYYEVIPQKILNCAKKGATNLHFSYLPNALFHDKRTKNIYRGRGVLSCAILENEKWQAVTFHYITAKIDIGPVIDYAWNRISKNTTIWDLQQKSEEKAYALFKKWLPKLILSKNKVKTLPAGRKKYYYFSNKDLLPQKEINLTMPKADLDRKVRAFDFPGREPAYFKLKIGSRIKKIYLRTRK